MPLLKWTRRHFLQSSATAAAATTALRSPGAFAEMVPSEAVFINSFGAKFIRIDPGDFQMGEDNAIPAELYAPLSYMTRPELQKMFPNGDPERFVLSDRLFAEGDPDEKPVHNVRITQPFYVSAYQVTNREFEQFIPSHRELRGKFGFSKDDEEAVIYVTWQEAADYCAWLSRKENRPYRLLTEAEWEYAARAGTTTLFSTGDDLPDLYLRNAQVTDFKAAADKVSLKVGETPPNPWGLFDMHGNVEEWVADWYGPYTGEAQSDPTGRAEGGFRVTRGGSHGTFAFYLRSANRSAALPDTRGFTIGFRVACGAAPRTRPLPQPPGRNLTISQSRIQPAPVQKAPFFRGPGKFVKLPEDSHGPLYHWHNHDTGIAECPNGDLLAIWYTCAKEQGRELGVACSRLRYGTTEWEPTTEFWNAPDRNDHCPMIWYDGEQTLYHFNGYALSHYWEPIAVIMRTSTDSGASWSPARFAVPEFLYRTMVCQPVLPLRDGSMLFGADAHPGDSAVWISADKGRTWNDPGGNINGIHTSVVELSDGRLMALGRGNNIDGFMPMSISADQGKTWTVSASTLPPITYTQRFVMFRLKEGPLFIASFGPNTEHFEHAGPTDREMSNLFAALSFDEGETWSARRLVTDDGPDRAIDCISNARVLMGQNTSEPAGYVSGCQGRDGTIHLLSSINHYAFNIAWITSGPRIAFKQVHPMALPQRTNLTLELSELQRAAMRVGETQWSFERTGDGDAIDILKGFTVEARITVSSAKDDAFELRSYMRSGCTMCNRYWLRVDDAHVSYWYNGGWNVIADATSGTATYRLAVRNDTAAQIYRDSHLIATYPASYEIGFAPPTRGNFVEWKFTGAHSKSNIETIWLDFEGAFAS